MTSQTVFLDQRQILAIPQCEGGIGKVITRLDSEDLIEGVRLQPFVLWPDDRGYFLEVHRMGGGIAGDFPPCQTQVSSAFSYPGTIKAFHYHSEQSDFWTPARGLFQVALVDLRTDSPTFGLKNTLYIGDWRPWQLLIPPGVGHGYKIVGPEPAMLVYLTDRFYAPRDEGRVAYNHPGIAYDWEIQHK